MNIIDLG